MREAAAGRSVAAGAALVALLLLGHLATPEVARAQEPDPTTTTLTIEPPGAQIAGNPVTLRVNVKSTSGNTPTGRVSIQTAGTCGSFGSILTSPVGPDGTATLTWTPTDPYEYPYIRACYFAAPNTPFADSGTDYTPYSILAMPAPPAPPAPGGGPLAGGVTGTGVLGTEGCPAGLRNRQFFTLRVAASTPSELLVDMCTVESTAKGGAEVRGLFALTTQSGQAIGSVMGNRTFRGPVDLLSADLHPLLAVGDLQGVADLELQSTVTVGAPPWAFSGTLRAKG